MRKPPLPNMRYTYFEKNIKQKKKIFTPLLYHKVRANASQFRQLAKNVYKAKLTSRNQMT